MNLRSDITQRYLDIAGSIILVLNPDGTVELINKRGSDILGYPEKEIVGKNWFDHFLPETIREQIREVFQKVQNDEVPLEEVFENREQIEIAKFYERLPKPTLIAIYEFLEEKIYFRDPHTETKMEE